MRTLLLGVREVTAVGAGDVRLGLAASRGVGADEVERGVSAAIELGLTFVEASEETDAERLVGSVVRALRARDRVVVACQVPQLAGHGLAARLPPRYVQERVEASLRATRLDALPLALLPVSIAWRESTAWPELVGTCARLVKEGHVRAWGAALDETDVPRDDEAREGLAAFVREPWLAALRVPYAVCARAAQPLVDAARAAKVLVLARYPLAGGALAGGLGPGVRLTPRDDRADLDDAALEQLAVGAAHLARFVKRAPPAARSCKAARAVLEQMQRVDAPPADTLAELALCFAIDRAGLALPRLHRAAHVVPALAAATAPPLPEELLAAISSAIPSLSAHPFSTMAR